MSDNSNNKNKIGILKREKTAIDRFLKKYWQENCCKYVFIN